MKHSRSKIVHRLSQQPVAPTAYPRGAENEASNLAASQAQNKEILYRQQHLSTPVSSQSLSNILQYQCQEGLPDAGREGISEQGTPVPRIGAHRIGAEGPQDALCTERHATSIRARLDGEPLEFKDTS